MHAVNILLVASAFFLALFVSMLMAGALIALGSFIADAFRAMHRPKAAEPALATAAGVPPKAVAARVGASRSARRQQAPGWWRNVAIASGVAAAGWVAVTALDDRVVSQRASAASVFDHAAAPAVNATGASGEQPAGAGIASARANDGIGTQSSTARECQRDLGIVDNCIFP